MRIPLIAALAAASTMSVLTTPALAREGCGSGSHRAPDGACVVNEPGVFYHGYGWWDGHRFWHARFRHHGVWRYR